ncbi:MAG: hypothetical protein ACFFEJ_19115 [Candidatus Thorarchaeota archaeon]
MDTAATSSKRFPPEIQLLVSFQIAHTIQNLSIYFEYIAQLRTYTPEPGVMPLSTLVFPLGPLSIGILVTILILSKHKLAFAGMIGWNTLWFVFGIPFLLFQWQSPFAYTALVSVSILILGYTDNTRKVFGLIQ